jgi:hypothetical protein
LLAVFGEKLPAVGQQVLADAERLFEVLLNELHLRVDFGQLLHRIFVH